MIKKFIKWIQELLKNMRVEKNRKSEGEPPDNIYPLW